MEEDTRGADATPFTPQEMLEPDDRELLGPQIDLDLVRALQSQPGLQVRPAVIVALGGTGIYSVRRAKQIMRERVGDVRTLNVLYVDTDTRAFLDAPGLAKVEPGEAFNFGGPAILPLVNHPEGHPWLFEQIPQPGLERKHYERVVRGAGCGQMRAVGRLTFLASFSSFRNRMDSALDDVQKLANKLATTTASGVTVQGDTVVYVVASLAGGTGSGTFLDVALLARQLAPTATLVGIFVLPDAFDAHLTPPERQLVRANAYAALKELQTLQEGRADFSLHVKTSSSAADDLVLPSGSKLFDLCYLIDWKNRLGQRLSRTEDVFELLARLLFHENGTPLGSRAGSTLVNLATVAGATPCPKTNLGRQFSTFANTVLRFPVDRVARYCVWSKIKEILEDVLVNGPERCDEKSVAHEVTAFLDQHDLNELGAANKLQDRLLRDDRTGAPLPAGERLAQTFGVKLGPKEFGTAIKEKLSSLESKTLARARKSIDQQCRELYLGPKADGEPLRAMLDEFFAKCVARFGASGSRRVWEELRSRVGAMKNEMLTENKAWRESGQKSWRSELDTARDGLHHMFRLTARFTQKDEGLKTAAIDAFNHLVDGELREHARVAAQKVFAALFAALDPYDGLLSRFLSTADGLNRQLANNLNAVQARSASLHGGFVLEMDVAEVADIVQYYAQNPVDARSLLDELMRELQSAVGNRRRPASSAELYMRLFSLDEHQIYVTLRKPVQHAYQSRIMGTSVVDYLKRAEKKTSNAVGAKLDALFAMCEPFWKAQPPVADFTFQEVWALGCAFVPGPSGFSPPPEVQRWAKQFGAGQGKPPGIEPTTAAYEIQLVRYTHGARAFYLDDAARWKTLYQGWSKKADFPLHLHASFPDVPELDSDEAARAGEALKGRRAFALAVALGFIAKRGEQFYFSLDLQSTVIGGAQEIQYHVPLATEWQTAFRVDGSRDEPQTGGVFVFQAESRAPRRLLLGSDRVAACKSLEKDVERTGLVLDALASYVAAVTVGAVKVQLTDYADYLDTYVQTAKALPAPIRNQVEQERALIVEYTQRLH